MRRDNRRWMILVAFSLGALQPTISKSADLPTSDDSVYVDQSLPKDAGWSGVYIGAYGDYKWIKSDISNGQDVDKTNGLGGGAYLGYNHELGNGVVVGLEGTAGLSAADGSAAGNSVKQDWETSLRARMGYAFEQNMIYGLAGVAASAFDLENAAGSDSNTHLGLTVGAGIETQLTDSITARAEYGYTDYSQRRYNTGAGPTKIDPSSHGLKLGVGLKF